MNNLNLRKEKNRYRK